MRLSKRIVEIVLSATLAAAVVAPGPALARSFTSGTQIEFEGKPAAGAVQGYESFFRTMAIWLIAIP